MLNIFSILFPRREDEKTVESISCDDFLSLVEPKLTSVTDPGTVVLLPFANQNVRGTIHEAKYHGSERAFKMLSLVLAEYLRDQDDGGPRRSPIHIVPVPLGKARRKERGFNQVEEVASRTIRILTKEGLDRITLVPDTLVRIRETVSQVSLPREKRRENMCGAFGAAHPVNPTHTYIVIDDVTTTGATLQSAIDALRVAGAIHIIPLALAH